MIKIKVIEQNLKKKLKRRKKKEVILNKKFKAKQ